MVSTNKLKLFFFFLKESADITCSQLFQNKPLIHAICLTLNKLFTMASSQVINDKWVNTAACSCIQKVGQSMNLYNMCTCVQDVIMTQMQTSAHASVKEVKCLKKASLRAGPWALLLGGCVPLCLWQDYIQGEPGMEVNPSGQVAAIPWEYRAFGHEESGEPWGSLFSNNQMKPKKA